MVLPDYDISPFKGMGECDHTGNHGRPGNNLAFRIPSSAAPGKNHRCSPVGLPVSLSSQVRNIPGPACVDRTITAVDFFIWTIMFFNHHLRCLDLSLQGRLGIPRFFFPVSEGRNCRHRDQHLSSVRTTLTAKNMAFDSGTYRASRFNRYHDMCQ